MFKDEGFKMVQAQVPATMFNEILEVGLKLKKSNAAIVRSALKSFLKQQTGKKA